jgi:hypothetical protein
MIELAQIFGSTSLDSPIRAALLVTALIVLAAWILIKNARTKQLARFGIAAGFISLGVMYLHHSALQGKLSENKNVDEFARVIKQQPITGGAEGGDIDPTWGLEAYENPAPQQDASPPHGGFEV